MLIASVGHSSDQISLLSEHKAEFSAKNIFIKYTIPGYSPWDAIYFRSTTEIKDFWQISFQVLAMLFTKEDTEFLKITLFDVACRYDKNIKY